MRLQLTPESGRTCGLFPRYLPRLEGRKNGEVRPLYGCCKDYVRVRGRLSPDCPGPSYSQRSERVRPSPDHPSREERMNRSSAALLVLSGLACGPAALSAGQVPDPLGPTEADAPVGAAAELPGPPVPIAPAVVNQAGEAGVTVRAVRVTEPMETDGVLDEAFYLETQAISEFVQSIPDAGAEPTELTEVWLGFDDENVYVGAKIWDSEGPDARIANEMRRDSRQIRQNDNFGVFFDTFMDRRNAVAFYTNALGALTDYQINNEGRPNRDWNPIWEIRTGRFEQGWTVEMAIPFRSLRYRPGREQVWGIQMRRTVWRRNEWNHLTWLPLSVGRMGGPSSSRVSMYGTLVGIEAPPPSRELEVKPFATSGLRTDMGVDPVVRNDGHADAGLDVKWGVTENLVADFTYNTDFAQVEVDEQQVNLTRFSLFFPEKREFFLESRGIFDFGARGGGGGPPGGGGGGGGGGRPGGGGGGGGGGGVPTMFYSRQIGLQDGHQVPIIGGARLTGKVGSFDVGMVNMQTDELPSIDAESTNFTVLRLARDVFARSSVGVIYQNRSESVVAEGSNQAWGVDGVFTFNDETSLQTYYAETHTAGLHGLDASYRGAFAYNADELGLQLGHLVVGDDFNPEIGFIRRKGFRQSSVSARFSPRTESISSIRQISLQPGLQYFENEEAGFLESRQRSGDLRVEFENSDQFTFTFTDSYENLVQDEWISGATMGVGRYSFRDIQASYFMGPNRPVQGRLSVRRGSYYDGEISSLGIGQGWITIHPQLSLEPSLSFNWIDLPQGHFGRHVALTRITYTMTPRAFVSGLVQYNAGSDTFSTNIRLRWEWAPGSELFVVYTEDRDTDVLGRRTRLDTRGLVVKVTRLFQL